MSRFDDLLDRVTDRLKIDPELRAEVRHELASHLEDSLSEFRTAGLSEEDAASKARESFGNEAQVAQQLWDANRKKIPARKVARAFGRFALAPIAAAVSVVAIWPALTSLAVVLMVAGSMASMSGLSSDQPLRTLADLLRFRVIWEMPPDDRLAFQGNRDVNTSELRVKPIVERWPDDKMFFAEYASRAMMNPKITNGPKEMDRAEVDRVLAIMERGEQLDPDNGVYPLLKAAVLVDASAEINELEDNDPKQLSFEYQDPKKPKENRWRFDEAKVVDAAMFERGVAEFRKAASKPFIESYAIPLAERRLAMLRQPKTLGEQLMRVMFSIEVLLPNLNAYRHAENCVLGHALHKAQAGDAETALSLTSDAKRIAAMTGAKSHVLVEFLVSWGMLTNADAHETMIYQLLGRKDEFEHTRQLLAARRQAVMTVRDLRSTTERNVQIKQRAGLAESTLIDNATVWSEADVRPGRIAEYAVLDQIALAMFVLALTLPLALRWMIAALKRMRGDEQPISVFVGWSRLWKVLLFGVIVPLIGYAMYVRIFHAREYGMGISLGRMVVEYATLACVMIIALRRLTDGAMQARAKELGLPAPGGVEFSRALIATGCVLAIFVVGYMIGWERAAAAMNGVSPVLVGPAMLLASAILIYALAWTRPSVTKVSTTTRADLLHRRLPDWILAMLLVPPVAVLMWLSARTPPSGRVQGLIGNLPIICAAVVVIIVLVLAWTFFKNLTAPSPGTTQRIRSAIPFPAAAALVLLLTVGVGARVTEKRIVSQYERGAVYFTHELERSTLAPLQQQLIAQLAK